MSTAMKIRGLSVAYGEKQIINNLDLDIKAHAFTGVIGPNGCGKSTLLKALTRTIPKQAGTIEVLGKNIESLGAKELARMVSLLPQSPEAPQGILVADLVALGRHPHQSWLKQWSGSDSDSVSAALQATGVIDLKDRPLSSLSGGQRQRVWLAMVLAQETDVLLLDEPTTYLDLSRAVEVLDLVDELHSDSAKTVVGVLHDLSLACRYCDDLVVINHGAVVAQGAPTEIITPELLRDVFALNARILPDPTSGTPLIAPVGRRRGLESPGTFSKKGHT